MTLSHQRATAPSPRRSHHRHRGVTIVETAIVLPLFLTMVFGFIDVGLAVFQTSQATSAAADGARAGILWEPDSPQEAAIEDAVRGRLVGQDVGSIDITCLTETGTAIACAGVNPDSGFVRVEVSWPYEPLSFVGAAFPDQDISGTATMAIIRQPSSSSGDT